MRDVDDSQDGDEEIGVDQKRQQIHEDDQTVVAPSLEVFDELKALLIKMASHDRVEDDGHSQENQQDGECILPVRTDLVLDHDISFMVHRNSKQPRTSLGKFCFD